MELPMEKTTRQIWEKRYCECVCVCAGCPGKKTQEIPNMLQQFATKYSPKGHLDVANILLGLLAI
eukprot:3891579-Ditylum_brightwellii.AAC.2